VKAVKPKIVRTPSAPFSVEDAKIIGEELLKIAEANRVADIRLLDKKLVFAAVEADPEHPLRRFYDWDVKRAARKHWLEWTEKLIASVRIEWKIGKFTKTLPITLSAEVPRMKHGTSRQRVLTEDVLMDDPMFASAVGLRLRNIDSALAQLETLTSCRKTPQAINELLERLRAALDTYKAAIGENAA
jgi:hypothetical protein